MVTPQRTKVSTIRLSGFLIHLIFPLIEAQDRQEPLNNHCVCSL